MPLGSWPGESGLVKKESVTDVILAQSGVSAHLIPAAGLQLRFPVSLVERICCLWLDSLAWVCRRVIFHPTCLSLSTFPLFYLCSVCLCTESTVD